MNVKDTKKYQEAIQWRDWQTCDLIAEEHEALVSQLKEANEKLAEKDKVIMSQEKERQSTERFWKEKIEQLEQRLQEAEEVVRFYGDPKSYKTESNVLGHERPREDTSSVLLEGIDGKDFILCVGGKRARAYQEKYLKKEEA